MIGIIDYGMGNLYSVTNAVKHLGFEPVISRDQDVLSACDHLILPGVGAFGDMMENLDRYELTDFIKEQVNVHHKPLLGICLGMQALFEKSYEKGETEGLGFLKGEITLIEDTSVRIPHIGWNALEKNTDHEILHLCSDRPFVYYVHSYYAKHFDPADLIGYSHYGSMTIPGLVIRGNLMGCQFHPEKSGEDGLRMLKYFLEVFS